MVRDPTVEVAGVQDFCKSGLVLSHIESRLFWRTLNIFDTISSQHFHTVWAT